MAIAIASIPVLTGEVGRNFEAQAQQTYEKHLNRSEAEKQETAERYVKGMSLVEKVLTKSHVGKR
jgi:hypothetical protein